MKPVVFVRFYATIHQPGLFRPSYIVSDINELRDYVNKFDIDGPYRVTALRENCVVNMDKKRKDISIFDKNKYIDGHPIIARETDAKIELILPKLMYPNDVSAYLIKKYGRLDFDPQKFDQNIPLFFNVFEHTSVGMRVSATSPAPRMKWHNVHCETLSKKDVVTDENLNQLWPENTGELPIGLVKLFNQGKAR